MAEGFTCAVNEHDEKYLSACADGEYRNTGYCVLHYPGEEKNKEDFSKVIQSKLGQENYDFGSAVFPEGASDFSDAIFSGKANFREATFKGKADFDGAIFKGEASFRKATFKREADFEEVTFEGEASFREATFKEKGDFAEANFEKQAGFRNATFEKEASFTEAVFKQEARFRRTIFRGFVEFKGPKSPTKHTFNARANFSAAKFEERAVFVGQRTFDIKQERPTFRNALVEIPETFSFDRVRLRPSWFIDTNVQRFRFTSTQWRGLRGGPPGSIEEEIRAIRNRRERNKEEEEEEEEYSQSGYPYDVLAKTCRELSANAEANHEYPLANEFHYWSMEALRKGRWHYLGWLQRFIRKNWRRVRTRFGRVATLHWFWRIGRREPLSRNTTRFGLIPTLYWALSGYGVRAARAFWMLVAIWAAFTILYVLVDPSEFKDLGQGIGYRWQAAVYSLLALARLNPEPRPEEPGIFQFLVGLEGILGPLQIALLVLAIRRKVMR